jgi:hypothetical protein
VHGKRALVGEQRNLVNDDALSLDVGLREHPRRLTNLVEANAFAVQ